MSHSIKSPRKLIEVALPLDAINKAAVRENYIYKGNPSAIHKWWAQRPLAAARAVIFAQLVNDPGYQQGGGFKYGKNKKEAAAERKRLFEMVQELVQWENNNNKELMVRANAEIRRSWRETCEMNKDHPLAKTLFDPDILPALYDPFAGSGAIPLEAQRLGLQVLASDLNPVAVLINKATIEIPPKFTGRRPVSLASMEARLSQNDLGLEQPWIGATGLAEDIRYYGAWIQSEALKRIGHVYLPVEITAAMASEQPDLQQLIGHKLAVMAWLWARTVKSPNPAFSHVDVPLVSTFVLSSKSGKEAYAQPIIEGEHYHFIVRTGTPPPEAENGTKASGRGSNFRCLISGTPISGDYIKAEGQAGRMGQRLIAIVTEGSRRRIYLPATEEMETIAQSVEPKWKPAGDIPARLTGGTCVPYGLKQWGDIFTPRQLTVLTTLSDLVGEAHERIKADATLAGMANSATAPDDIGKGARAYADAVATYLAFAVSKASEYSSSLTVWYSKEDRPKGLFARQAIPMVWDFPEQNILGDIGGSFIKSVKIVAESVAAIHSDSPGIVFQADAAASNLQLSEAKPFISTDPPYYNNIAYADLSDFFYVWLRKSLRTIYPETFGTIVVPKAEELVAAPYRHGSAEKAEEFFLHGMTRAMGALVRGAHPGAPVTIYYAFKQSENLGKGDVSSTGWATFLEAVIGAGFQITGTWPMRTERQSRSVGLGTNSLASSIVLVCRKRPADAPTVSRREFLRELNAVLPEALDEMTKGTGEDRSPVAPVDLSQAIIGPGMAVFSKCTAVLEADGSPMSVRTALQLINRFLAEDDFDSDTQFCLHWFEQHGWSESVFGEADVLARSKSTSVDAMKDAGVLQSGGGKVRLLKWSEYPTDWDPRNDTRTPVWEALHQLIRSLKEGGESASGAILAALGGKAESARQLAYRLYTLCERLGQAEDARAYNELITSWTGIESAATSVPKSADPQGVLFEN
jgi:putative DNA methylase